MKNTDTRYGPVTKTLHWAIFLLFLNQFVVAAMMMNTPDDETTAGFTQGTLYDWHKSIGLVALGVAVVRFAWRKATPVPDWAPNLSEGEKHAVHRIENVLYLCMFLMPVSGFVFVMAGDFGVKFFSTWRLPNPIGVHPALATAAKWTHAVTAALIGATLAAHWTVGIRHQLSHRDRYLQRILPFTHQQ